MFHYLARRLEKNHCLAAHMGNSRVLAHTQTPIFCVCIYINMYIYIYHRVHVQPCCESAFRATATRSSKLEKRLAPHLFFFDKGQPVCIICSDPAPGYLHKVATSTRKKCQSGTICNSFGPGYLYKVATSTRKKCQSGTICNSLGPGYL